MKNNSYDDIINLPHPVSKNHPQMPLRDRAAQFAPFAALTGHDAAIKETARELLKRSFFHEPNTLLMEAESENNRHVVYIKEF